MEKDHISAEQVALEISRLLEMQRRKKVLDKRKRIMKKVKSKLKEVIIGFFLCVFLLSATAMDSPNMLIPIIGLFVSAPVLLVMAKMEGEL